MDSNRFAGFGQSSDDTWNPQPQYPSYPPPPEYIQPPKQSYPSYPPEPDYYQAATPTGASTPAQSGYLGPDYDGETPTNQLTDIRYDQPNKRSKWIKAGGGASLGILGILLKFGAAILGVLKYAFAFFKFGSVFSIVISMAIYAAAFGWQFALGIIFLLFLHEMGHV